MEIFHLHCSVRDDHPSGREGKHRSKEREQKARARTKKSKESLTSLKTENAAINRPRTRCQAMGWAVQLLPRAIALWEVS